VEQVDADSMLRDFAIARGTKLFEADCASCRGPGGVGREGVLVLSDDDWLWGDGTLPRIERLIRHGIRDEHDPDTRSGYMPEFGAEGILTRAADRGRGPAHHGRDAVGRLGGRAGRGRPRGRRPVTDRGWTSRQPDETPVEELPLQPFTVNALRTAGVLTLGELGTMGDHELLRLRRFGRGALADVRALVPAAAAPSGQVTIAGRTFTLGAVYAPRRVIPGLESSDL